jgi:hypothetical protein
MRRPVTATGRHRGIAALLGPVAAVVLLVAACTTSDEELADPVVPLGTIVPLTGGGALPDPARVLLQEADRELRAGDFDAAAETARRIGAGADPATRCVADAVQGVAEVNRGNIETGLTALQDGECAIEVVPDDVRKEMATLVYRTEAVGSALTGDEDAAERFLENALQMNPDMADVIIDQFCQAVKQAGSFERCASPVTTTQPVTSTTQAPPSPSVTSPPPSTSRPLVPTTVVPTTSMPPVPTSAVPTTSMPPVPTSAVPTTSMPPVTTTTSDSAPTTSAG